MDQAFCIQNSKNTQVSVSRISTKAPEISENYVAQGGGTE